MADQLGFKRRIRVLGALIEVSGLLVTAGAYLLIPSYFSQHNIGLICGVVLLICGLILTIAGMTRQPIPFVRSIAGAVAVADVAVLIWTGVFLQLWVQGVGRFS